jgi:C4-dicarboxylate-specific signal transduction histidine kinase
VVVDFADDGAGVATDLRDDLFQPYCTGKPRGRGVGLGLTISRDLARNAGGQLELLGPPERANLPGTEPWPMPVRTIFRLTLPIAR